jgi:hypothetical protein
MADQIAKELTKVGKEATDIVDGAISAVAKVTADVTKGTFKELGKADKKIIAQTKNIDLVQMVAGSTVGFFVWMFLSRATGEDPIPESTIINTNSINYNSPSLKTEPEDIGIGSQINNSLKSFW